MSQPVPTPQVAGSGATVVFGTGGSGMVGVVVPVAGASATAGVSGPMPASGGSGAIPMTPVTPPGPPVTPPEPPAKWQSLDCSESSPNPIGNVKLTRTLDYLAIYASYPSGVGMAGQYDANTLAIAETGQQCRTASDVATCQSRVKMQSAPSSACATQGMCGSFLISTLGDTVTRSDERSALLTLLGPIDSPDKALVVAEFDQAFDGSVLQCPGSFGSPDGTQTLATGDGYDVRAQWDTCGSQYSETIHIAKDGTVTVTAPKQLIAHTPCGTGRRPEGLIAAARVVHAHELGGFFAGVARLEAASVFAFERLARELSELGAPEELSAAALRSALDEVRHARTVSALAARYRARPEPVAVSALSARTPFAIALENAVEGCVRETYGALLAAHQAKTALDEEVRHAMRAIARDELRHGLLAWQVAAWLEPRLCEAERRALSAARLAALGQLERALVPDLTPHALAAIGWPSREVAAQMLARLGAALGIEGALPEADPPRARCVS